MVPLTKITARDFGEALKAAREETGVTVNDISERTKISVRMLAALESGEFGRLPNLVFARIFLRQYLDFIGAAPERWLQAFEAAWRRSAESSQAFVMAPAVPIRKGHAGPWIVGLLLVGAGGVGVLLVEKVNWLERRDTRAPAPAPAAMRPLAPPTPATPPAPEAASQPGSLVIRTGKSACWVEVRVAGEAAASRLLKADSAWEIGAAGKNVDLMLGDAGAASIEYLGRTQSPAGRPGEVARIHLTGNPLALVRR